MSDRITATHESGHVVAGLRFGYDIARVVLCPASDRHAAGVCEIVRWLDEVDQQPSSALVYLLAGGQAERRVNGGRSPGAAQDLVQAEALACAITEQPKGHPRVRALLAAADALAAAMMRDAETWAAIQRIAQALERQRSLTGYDVRVLLREGRR